jgi:hypothetical protein
MTIGEIAALLEDVHAEARPVVSSRNCNRRRHAHQFAQQMPGMPMMFSAIMLGLVARQLAHIGAHPHLLQFAVALHLKRAATEKTRSEMPGCESSIPERTASRRK